MVAGSGATISAPVEPTTSRNSSVNLIGLMLIVSGGAAFAQGGDHLRAVLVTGASSGIGLSITEVLASNGFHVYAGARKKPTWNDLSRRRT